MDGKRQVQDAPLSEIGFMQDFATNTPTMKILPKSFIANLGNTLIF
jgi:hypothetical protein